MAAPPRRDGHELQALSAGQGRRPNSLFCAVQRRACSLSEKPRPGRLGTCMRPSLIIKRSLNSGSNHSKCSSDEVRVIERHPGCIRPCCGEAGSSGIDRECV